MAGFNLQSLLGKMGIGSLADVDEEDLYNKPIAQSRITRTPIYQVPGDKWDSNKGGEYNSTTRNSLGGIWEPANIKVRQGEMSPGSDIIPHESTHAIYDQAGLNSVSLGDIPPHAMDRLLGAPNLYPMSTSRPAGQPYDAYAERVNAKSRANMIANEGLAYSVGTAQGDSYVRDVADQIKDPVLRQQLLRLHENALRSTSLNSTPLNNSVGSIKVTPLTEKRRR